MSNSKRVPSEELLRRLNDPASTGFSVDESTGESGGPGVYASEWGAERGHHPTATAGDITAYRDEQAGSLGRRGAFLGGWRTGEHRGGGDYLDVSRQFDSVPDATTFGRKNAQHSVAKVTERHGAFDSMGQSPVEQAVSYHEVPYGADTDISKKADPAVADGYRDMGLRSAIAQRKGMDAQAALAPGSTTASPEYDAVRQAGDDIARLEMTRTLTRDSYGPTPPSRSDKVRAAVGDVAASAKSRLGPVGAVAASTLASLTGGPDDNLHPGTKFKTERKEPGRASTALQKYVF